MPVRGGDLTDQAREAARHPIDPAPPFSEAPSRPMPPRHHTPASASQQLSQKPFVWLRNKLLAGIALALPLMVTFWIVKSLYELLNGLSEPMLLFFARIANEFISNPVRQIDVTGDDFKDFVRFTGFLIPLVVFVALGVAATNVIGVRVVAAMEQLLLRVPIVSFVYKSLRQVMDSFRGLGGRKNFKRVVYVDYPAAGMKMIGFVTGQFTDAVSGHLMVSIFVPGALSPMTGLLLVVEAEKVVDAPISIEDAMKLVFSGGLVPPSQAQASPGSVTTGSDELRDIAKADAAFTTDLPPDLPRAEDFDFGDPDILADADQAAAGSRGSSRRGWGLIFPWRRG